MQIGGREAVAVVNTAGVCLSSVGCSSLIIHCDWLIIYISSV